MGFRTVVMLSNDHSHEWSKDPNLGSDIARAMNFAGQKYPPGNARTDYLHHGYGRVVECTHADTETLVKLTHYTGFNPIAYSDWRVHGHSINEEERNLLLLKRAAESLGYRLVRKSTRKA